MLCRNCGKELSENDKFCIACGTPVEEKIVDYTFEEPKKRSKSKLPLILISLVLVVGIVAAVLLSGVFANPTAKLLKAVANSVAAWNEAAVLDTEELAWLTETREEYSGEMSLWLEDFPEMVQLEGFGVRMNFDYSQPQRQINMVMAPTFGYADILHAQIVLKDNELYFGSEELTKDTYYMIHTDRLGQELNALGAGVPELENYGANVFDLAETMQQSNVDTLEALENLTQVFRSAYEQIQVEKGQSGEIDVNGVSKKADGYHVVIPQETVTAIMDAVEPLYLAQNSTDAMLELYSSMGLDAETLAMMEMSLREANAQTAESFAEARKALEELGDLELDVYVSDNYVAAVEFSVTHQEVTVDFRMAFGGGENYVDKLSVSAKDQDGEGFLIVSEGDHGAKNGTFTDKTTMTIGGDMDTTIHSELSYTPDAQSDNLAWALSVQEPEIGETRVEMKGQLTLGAEEFFLRLDELTVDDGYTVGTFGIEYSFGKYAPQTVDTSNYMVLAEMTDADMTAASNSLMMNAMEWLSWVQENFPELVSMLMG